ncbi:DUF1822 family protein [Leptolyngbya ohadii]|uniref:DUF1822 family protein n=1 Tax=Leptolyngbya ohadii TaxID=1962290 RepID=UPI0015C68D50|nr:DUF1822 family protein [Leptolyngbya ohadii]
MTQSNAFDMTLAIPLPIPQSAIARADRFAQYQPNPQKASQVRQNTLAVCVMQDYLQMMGIDSQLSGDSWNPVTQMMADVADLEVEGLGRLECRPVSPNGVACPVPPEVWHDRIGYVVVQINEPQREAQLLGFVETVEAEELPLSQLQPPENLLDHLDRLTHPATAAQPTIAAQTESQPLESQPLEPQSLEQVNRSLTSLSQWLQNRFQEGWETIDSLFSPRNQPAYGFRSSASTVEPSAVEPNSIRRAKRVNLSGQATAQPLILVVEILPHPEETAIRVQLHPELSAYLPSGVRLAVLDNMDSVFLQAESRSSDNYLQLEFSAATGEAFSVQVQSEGSIVTEAFVI